MKRSRRPAGTVAVGGRASGRDPGAGLRTRDHRGIGLAGTARCRGEGSPVGRRERGVGRTAAGRSPAAAAARASLSVCCLDNRINPAAHLSVILFGAHRIV